MTNGNKVESMLRAYHSRAYTDKYIVGFAFHGDVYALRGGLELLKSGCKVERASSKADGDALRYKPDATTKAILAEHATRLCSEAELEEAVKSSRYNRGEIFESLIFERAGQTWSKDNVPFTVAGDIEIDGVAYQIKYQKASIISEGQLRRLGL